LNPFFAAELISIQKTSIPTNFGGPSYFVRALKKSDIIHVRSLVPRLYISLYISFLMHKTNFGAKGAL
jgi:hypothetical protein